MTVYLVGAGPGDPGLLTRRGAELLARADVVVYDRLASAALLGLAPPGAERVHVGKAPGRPGRPGQQAINALLVEHGRRGACVVRLKGGDPFTFGRGADEAAALMAAGVTFEVVPGVSAAIAGPAYAGVPVTRDGVASFTVVTGHAPDAVDWGALARLGGTVVVLMGSAQRAVIARRLMDGGLAADVPVMAVTNATRSDQRSVRTTLAGLGDEDVAAPSVITIGAVADSDLGWYERRPLFGKAVVVTRSRAQASDLVERLHDLGAGTVELPVIEIGPSGDGGAALVRAAAGVGGYAWVVFTSPNAVPRFFAALATAGLDTRALAGTRVASIGPGTAAALAVHGVVADLVPERFVAESLLDAFPDGPGRVLLPRAAEAREVLPEGLRAKGFEVDVVEAYRTSLARPSAEALRAAAGADAITFTSSSTVTNYLEVAAPVPPVVACIGPVTADTARRAGLTVDVVAAEHTVAGLVAALTETLAP